MDLFSGDPKVILTEEGADMVFKGGQPVMDQGWENLSLMSLLTDVDWAGNELLDPEEQIGSNYEKLGNQSITLSNINNMRIEAQNALKNKSFGEIQVSITNPSSSAYKNEMKIFPPNGITDRLSIVKNSQNWVHQIQNPASQQV